MYQINRERCESWKKIDELSQSIMMLDASRLIFLSLLVKFVSSQWCAVSGYAQGDDKSMDSDCAEHMIP